MPRRFPALLALLLGGCALAEPPELDVEAQWSDAMRRLGMFAFYPATENVQVGDVFLQVPPPSGEVVWLGRRIDAIWPGSQPDHDGTRFSLVRIATLSPGAPGAPTRPVSEQQGFDLAGHLQAQQAERLRIQPLPRPPGPAEGVTAADAKDLPRQLRPVIETSPDRPAHLGHADQEPVAPRLQRSAIPALRVARVSEAQLNASGVFGNLGAFLGITSGRQTALTISLGNVQELQLDAWRAAALYEANAPRLFAEQLAPEDLLLWLRVLRHGRNNRYALDRAACKGDGSHLQDQGVQVAVVTRVVYAGSIEYAFSRSTETAVRAAADLAAVLSGPLTPQIPRTEAPKPATGAAPPTPTEPGGRAEQQLAARFAGLPSLVHPSDPRAGAQLSLGIGSFGSLSLRETFNRPIAVGAGSRFVISFHQALAGAADQLPERFARTVRACRAMLEPRDVDVDEAALWEAMGGRRDTRPQVGGEAPRLGDQPEPGGGAAAAAAPAQRPVAPAQRQVAPARDNPRRL